MSENSENITDQWQDLARSWTDFVSKMSIAGMTNPSPAPPPEMARMFRDATFSAMTQHIDEYLRSSQFLEAMKKNLDQSLEFQKQMNETMTRARHSTQGTAKDDVDTLLRSVRHLEQRFLGRLENLENRIEKLSTLVESALNGKSAISDKRGAKSKTKAKKG